FETMRAAAEVAGRPLSCLLVQVNDAPDRWRDTLDGVRAARASGMAANCQVGCRPIGVLMGLETSRHPFDTHPAWHALSRLSPAERVARLRADTALRRTLLEPQSNARPTADMLARTYPLGPRLDYEPDPATSIAARAAAAGCDPLQLALDLMLADGGKGLMLHPFENYHAGNLDVV